MCSRIDTSVVVTMGLLASSDIISTFYNLCLLLQLCWCSCPSPIVNDQVKWYIHIWRFNVHTVTLNYIWQSLYQYNTASQPNLYHEGYRLHQSSTVCSIISEPWLNSFMALFNACNLSSPWVESNDTDDHSFSPWML